MKEAFRLSLVIGTVIMIIGIMIYTVVQDDRLKKQQFIDWCIEEYQDANHANLPQYCEYLYTGKVK